MAHDGKTVKAGKTASKEPPTRAKGGASSPSPASAGCPKAEKDCSTCKITVCPEEEI